MLRPVRESRSHDGHALHISGTGENIKISVVDEHGIAEEPQARQQHFIQGMFTGKGILQASVPLSVFGEDFLYQLKGIQKVGAAFQLYDRTAWMDTGDINTSHSDKINIPVIEERLIHIRTLKQVNIPGIQFFPFL